MDSVVGVYLDDSMLFVDLASVNKKFFLDFYYFFY